MRGDYDKMFYKNDSRHIYGIAYGDNDNSIGSYEY